MATDPSRPFTALAEPALEARIAADVEHLRHAVGAAVPGLAGLVLGGGYGRGEGGGRRLEDGWQASNDYDLFAVVAGLPRWRLPALREKLAALGGELEVRFGVEIELAPVRREDLGRLPFTMMWCELVAGHVVVAGSADLLAATPPMPPQELPLIEAVHYLANRGALLLMAEVEALPPERRWKFVHKAWLAVVASVLIAAGRFRAGYGPRLAELEADAGLTLPGIDRDLLLDRGTAATRDRLAPSAAPPPAELDRRADEARRALLAAWGALETERLGAAPGGWEAYAASRRLLPARPGAALVRQLRLLGWRGLWPVAVALEPPRGRVLRALPRLLDQPTASTVVARLLGAVPRSWEDQAQRLLVLWRRT